MALYLQLATKTRTTRSCPDGIRIRVLEILSETKIFTKSKRLAIVARSQGENIPVFATTSLGDKPINLKGAKAWMNEILTELSQCMLDPKSEVSQFPLLSLAAEHHRVDDFRHSCKRFIVRK